MRGFTFHPRAFGLAFAACLAACEAPHSRTVSNTSSQQHSGATGVFPDVLTHETLLIAWQAVLAREPLERDRGVQILLAYEPSAFRSASYSTSEYSPVAQVHVNDLALLSLGSSQDPTGMRWLMQAVPQISPTASRIVEGSGARALLAADELLAGLMESGEAILDPAVYAYAVIGRRLILDEMAKLDPPPRDREQIKHQQEALLNLSKFPHQRPQEVP